MYLDAVTSWEDNIDHCVVKGGHHSHLREQWRIKPGDHVIEVIQTGNGKDEESSTTSGRSVDRLDADWFRRSDEDSIGANPESVCAQALGHYDSRRLE